MSMDLYFKRGTQVEISRNEQGYIGSWFLGKIISINKKDSSVVVEYNDLLDEDEKEKVPLREEVDVIDIRLPQPVEQRRKFDINDGVDAHYHDGWWEGIVTRFNEEKNKYVVFFRHSREMREVRASKLRIHREWVSGNWHPPLEDSNHVGVDQVPVESREVKVPVKSSRVQVSESKKHKSQPQGVVVDGEFQVPVKSREVEEPVKSPTVKVSVSKKHKSQPQDVVVDEEFQVRVESREAEVPVKSPSVKVSEVKKHKSQPQDVVVDEVPVESTKVEVPVKSPKVKEPASKKRKSQPQDDLSTPSKVPVKSPKISPKIEVPVKSSKGKVPASKKQKRKVQPRDDVSTPSKDVSSPAEMQDVSLPVEMQDISSPSEMQDVPVSSEYTPNKHGLRPGQIVEVSTAGEGFEGAWFSATLLKILNADKYLIKYQKLTHDDGKTLLIEEVDSLHIRPCPPEISIVDRFDTHEEVDALYNDGWWVGKISKVLKDDKYKVYFSGTKGEEKIKHSELRVHQDWINGQWVIPT